MAEYIERETILDAISEQRRFYLHERDGETDMEKLYLLWGSDNALTTMEDIMSDIPTADVAPVVHGKWVVGGVHGNGVIGNWKCDICKGVSLKETLYCPYCGAKMTLEE